MKTVLAAAAVALALGSAPAAAVTFNFGSGVAGTAGQSTSNTGYSYSAEGYTATLTGYSWPDAMMLPSAFITFADGAKRSDVFGPVLSATRLGRDQFGVGVCGAGENFSSEQCQQTETNQNNEVLSVKIAPGSFKLVKAVFSLVDNDDTLGLFGVRTIGGVETIERIGFTGLFNGPGNNTGFGGGATGTGTSVSGSGVVYTVSFNTQSYSEFLFANNNNNNDGYRLNSITAVVPEPATWALLILGFGLVGASLRSRRRRVAA